MKLFTRKIYRKFPELDGYSDAQCRRIIEAVTTRTRHRFAIALIMAAMAVPVAIPCLIAAAAISAIYHSCAEWMPVWVPLLAVLLVFAAGLTGVVKSGLFLGESHLHNRLIATLGSGRECWECKYFLVGLTADENGFLICPECGAPTLPAPGSSQPLQAAAVQTEAASSQTASVPRTATRGATP